MDKTSDSPATAENPQADGSTPPPAQNDTKPLPTAEQAIASDNIDAIRAHMRANNGAMSEEGRRREWVGFGEEEQQPGEGGEQPAGEQPTSTEAQPGEEGSTPKAAAPEPKPDAEPAPNVPRKDTNRVRITRFADDDKTVLKELAKPENEGKTFDQVRDALRTAGTLAKPPESTPKVPAAPKSEPAEDPIAKQQAVIDALKLERDKAKTAYDLDELTTKQDELFEARDRLRELKDEQRARAHASEQQAQTQLQAGVAKAEQAAVSMFPDAGVEGSALYEAIEDMIDSAKPEEFNSPDWPITFAARAAAQIGYRPSSTAAPAQQTPVVPKRPARPVAPSPASGASPAAAPAREPSLADRMNEAGDDPEKIKALLREAGTRRLD